jgi:hypothetical protein
VSPTYVLKQVATDASFVLHPAEFLHDYFAAKAELSFPRMFIDIAANVGWQQPGGIASD